MKKNNWEPSAQLGVGCTTVHAAGYFAMAKLAPSAPLCVFPENYSRDKKIDC